MYIKHPYDFAIWQIPIYCFTHSISSEMRVDIQRYFSKTAGNSFRSPHKSKKRLFLGVIVDFILNSQNNGRDGIWPDFPRNLGLRFCAALRWNPVGTESKHEERDER